LNRKIDQRTKSGGKDKNTQVKKKEGKEFILVEVEVEGNGRRKHGSKFNGHRWDEYSR
jgi:hypothetical protein